jgi:subtilase family serine protease
LSYCADGLINHDVAPDPPCSHTKSQLKDGYINNFVLTLTDIQGHHTLIQLTGDLCNAAICTTTIPVRNYAGYHVQITANYHINNFNKKDHFSILPAVSCPSNLVFASDFATPDFLRKLYSIPLGLTAKHQNNSQSVVEFEAQYFDPLDVTTFLDFMGQRRIAVDKIIGPNDPAEGRITGGESQLDIQVMLGLAPGARTTFWSVAGHDKDNPEEPFIKWINQINDHPNPPLVHSVSYGDLESGLPLYYTSRLNLEFAKLGLRGLTIIVASGDQGISSDWGQIYAYKLLCMTIMLQPNDC